MTVTSTFEACASLCGVTQDIAVLLIYIARVATCPKRQRWDALGVKLDPRIITIVPPSTGPLEGVID